MTADLVTGGSGQLIASLTGRMSSAIPAGAIRHRHTVESTNLWAREESPYVSTPAIFLADHQTAGRGRLGREWIDTAGDNVLVSLLLDAPPDSWRGLTPLIAAAAAAEAIERTEPTIRVDVKWPNDLLVAERKIGGLLTELIGGEDGARVIIGIGVNVNQRSFPTDLRYPPSSIALAAGHDVDRHDVLAELMEAVVAAFRDARNAGPRGMMERYRGRLAGVGSRVRFVRVPDGTLEGVMLGVEDDGAIAIATDEGILRFHAGEISTLRED